MGGHKRKLKIEIMQYYISNNGEKAGPFDLNDMLANGLTRDSLVWCQGMADWQPALQVPEVAALLNQVPPQPASQPAQQSYQQSYQQANQQSYQQAYQQPYQQPYAQSMDFGESIKVCFNKYADFEGRASRAEFWWFYLFNLLLYFITCGVACIATIIPSYAVGSRRLHDSGKSGWLQLLGFIPLVGLILIYWFAIDGDPGENQYGPRPAK